MNDAEFEKYVDGIRSKSRIPLNYGTFPDPRQGERRWICYSCAYAELWLMLECSETGAQGVVKDPSRDEWMWAYDCPSNPKLWPDNSRVTLMKEGDRNAS